ncbi:hypothetical protein MtrunA17_Chr4g0058851 [Medicago truncatula]|uniref:Embryo defective 2759 protein n=1 Tax=Medicago truncatula TaxID=3880 RepID=A0A396IGW5_MEDTR|nr:uncharacterized protein LOC25493749 [Medicago truncatula]RHN63494.1 hypothetical protein MtrunA17_Chr4g0058851 [Medicago truncatula]
MVFVSHQPQGLNVTFSTRNLPWNKRLKLKQCLTKHHLIGRADWHHMLKQTTCLSVGPPHICGSKFTPLTITAFKGSDQNDDSIRRDNGLKVRKTSVRVEEKGGVKSKSPKTRNVPLPSASDADESLAASSGVHKLFKKWLTILCSPPSNQRVEEILGEPPPGGLPETSQGMQRIEKSQTLKVVWSTFQALDATIKIPLLIFAPFFLAVNAIYGPEVSKELTPLWVMGPFIVALYIKMVQVLCALYVYSFKQTVKVIKSLPSFCKLAHNYVFDGKIKEDIKVHILQPILNIKNADYKQLTIKLLKVLAEWIGEKYLDFVESIWPYYCRTIRFLKRSNLI